MTNSQLASKLDKFAEGIAFFPIKVMSKIFRLGNSSNEVSIKVAVAMASVVVTSAITVPMVMVANKLRKP